MNTTTAVEPGQQPEPRRDLRQRPPVRLIAFVLGIALIVVGGSMLAYVGWEYYGTDILARRTHADLRDQLKASWKYPTVADVVGPEAAGAPLGSAVALIRIPSFGADYEVPIIEGVRDSDLAKGIGHFPGTGPGQIGNFALAAHRVTNGEPFRDLPSLRPGDEIIVETADAIYRYILDTDPNDLVVPFTDGWVIDPVPVPPPGKAPPGMPALPGAPVPSRAIITLTSCSELFHTDDRMVAFGHLVSALPK